jgi:hypothetical protein
MRKSFWGLSGLVNNVMGKDPRSGALFAFFNKRRDMVKLLWYEPQGNARGFSIWMRKLDEGCFSKKVHVSEPTPSLSVTISELSFLIFGRTLWTSDCAYLDPSRTNTAQVTLELKSLFMIE